MAAIPVSFESLPLPTGAASQTTLEAILAQMSSPSGAGAATAAAQATGNTSLASLDTKLPAQSAGRLPAETDDRLLTSLIDDSTAGTTYVCEAAVGTATSAAAWRIQKIVVAAGVTRITWAGGGAMNQVADNRAALAYA